MSPRLPNSSKASCAVSNWKNSWMSSISSERKSSPIFLLYGCPSRYFFNQLTSPFLFLLTGNLSLHNDCLHTARRGERRSKKGKKEERNHEMNEIFIKLLEQTPFETECRQIVVARKMRKEQHQEGGGEWHLFVVCTAVKLLLIPF